jgi:hypothetical protein
MLTALILELKQLKMSVKEEAQYLFFCLVLGHFFLPLTKKFYPKKRYLKYWIEE